MTMAASDEFPRNWVLDTGLPASGTPTITIPAQPGVAHVLTGIKIKAYSGSTTGTASWTAKVTSGDGSVLVEPVFIVLPEATAGSITSDEAEWTGQIAVPPDVSLTVAFNSAIPAGMAGALSITGYAM